VIDKKKAVSTKDKDKNGGFKRVTSWSIRRMGVGKVLGVENQDISGHTLQ